MARESYESKQRRAARAQDTIASGVWVAKATAAVSALPVGTVIRLGDEFAAEHGLTEPMLRKLNGVLRMDAVFVDGPKTGLKPDGKYFEGYTWTVR